MTNHLDQDASPAITGRPRAAALLGTTALLAYAAPFAATVLALGPAPVAAAVPVPASSRALHAPSARGGSAALDLAAQSHATAGPSALKYPNAAGD